MSGFFFCTTTTCPANRQQKILGSHPSFYVLEWRDRVKPPLCRQAECSIAHDQAWNTKSPQTIYSESLHTCMPKRRHLTYWISIQLWEVSRLLQTLISEIPSITRRSWNSKLDFTWFLCKRKTKINTLSDTISVPTVVSWQAWICLPRNSIKCWTLSASAHTMLATSSSIRQGRLKSLRGRHPAPSLQTRLRQRIRP